MSFKASIIIPVYNDKERLKSTLKAIKDQIATEQNIEAIVIDNGSTDDTVQWLERSDQIKLLSETKNLNSPYSCRNRGIEIAKGDVIILLDATCCPQIDWLAKGLRYLESTQADIVGGNVVFDFEGKVTGAKLYDSMTNIKMEESIKKGVAKTANLFIKKSVFDKIGLFPEGIRSGADVRWTYKATSSGLKLVFCPEAIVYKPARSFKELVKKQWRVGLHQPLIWKDQGKPISLLNAVKKIIIPVSPISVLKMMRQHQNLKFKGHYVGVLFSAQIVKMTMGLANFKGILRIKKSV